MIIKLRTGKEGVFIEKEVTTDCAVSFLPDGSRYMVDAEVIEIDEHLKSLRVRGLGFEGWISIETVCNVMPKGVHHLNEAASLEGEWYV